MVGHVVSADEYLNERELHKNALAELGADWGLTPIGLRLIELALDHEGEQGTEFHVAFDQRRLVVVSKGSEPADRAVPRWGTVVFRVQRWQHENRQFAFVHVYEPGLPGRGIRAIVELDPSLSADESEPSLATLRQMLPSAGECTYMRLLCLGPEADDVMGS
jgi:hypothetical protein